MPILPDLNALPLPQLYDELASTGLVRRLLELARDEDLGAAPGSAAAAISLDITTASMADPRHLVTARINTRQACTIAGLATVPMLIDVFGGSCEFNPLANDGDRKIGRATIGMITGPFGRVLSMERVLLNLLSRLSGVATLTAAFVDAAKREAPGSAARIYDTRKTTPGLRVLEKYAVRCGGGLCHRLGLHDAALIKDNHLAGIPLGALGEIIEATAAKARASRPLRFVEVEVDSLDQLDVMLALPTGIIDIVLLDNMDPARLTEAVRRRDTARSKLQLEASGGVRLDTVGAIAATGIDRISAGALTHQAVSIDIGLDLDV